MHVSPPSVPPADRPDPWNSALYALAVLHAARQSGDHVLEREARKRLARFGVRVILTPADDAPSSGKGVGRG